MGRSVSYPSAASVVAFKSFDFEGEESNCKRCNALVNWHDEGRCRECGRFVKECDPPEYYDFNELIEDFRQHLKTLFPSVEEADKWIGHEDHILAENDLALFGMSEYGGLVAYWIVPASEHYDFARPRQLEERWIKSIADKFVAAFGELSKVGSMSNGEGVYRRIDK